MILDASLDSIMAVMAAAFDPAFGEAWSRRQVADALLVGNCHHALVRADRARAGAGTDDAPAVGFRLSRAGLDEEELLLLAVDPAFRQRGLGAAMLASLLVDARSRGARRLLLEMRRGNPAEALYRRFGFVPVGRRPNYYRTAQGPRIDAITFALAID